MGSIFLSTFEWSIDPFLKPTHPVQSRVAAPRGFSPPERANVFESIHQKNEKMLEFFYVAFDLRIRGCLI